MSRINTFYSTTLNSNNRHKILFAVVTNNLTELKTLVNESNVNNIIDDTNRYTALHYAVNNRYKEIIKYLLDIGADPKIKQSESKDAFELALDVRCGYLFDYFKEKQNGTISNLNFTVTENERKITQLQKTNDYLTGTIDNYKNTILTLKDDIKVKDDQIKKLKTRCEESDTAYMTLLKKQRK
jgi:ankyrin repeat protein